MISQKSPVQRQQLQQIISGLTEGVILIDPDQTISWANAAALRMHGASAVEELGATVSEYRQRFRLRYRNNHVLEADDYPVARVVAGEAFSDVVVEVIRDGAEADGAEASEWIHRVRSIVLTDDEGEPDCLVLVVTDATEEFTAIERFEKAFNANPAPAVICRVSDLRYVRVNQGFMDMTGYASDAVLGRSVYDLDVMQDADRRELGKERLSEWRSIPQMEATLQLPDGSTKLVIVAGQPIELGDEPCMLFTFADLEPRRKAEGALKQSEERFAKTFRLAPVPMKICTVDGFRILDVNDAFLQVTGYDVHDVIGRSPAEIELWDSGTTRLKLEKELVQSGSLRNIEARLKTKTGDMIDCLVSAETVMINGEPCVLDVFQDISARKHSELELISAIETVMSDGSWFSRSVVEKLANLRAPQAGESLAAVDDLTPRERHVLELICRGDSDGKIADELAMSRNTVRNHVSRIYAKIDVHSRSEAIVWARARGIFGPASGAHTSPKER